jgi:hypothetical protein
VKDGLAYLSYWNDGLIILDVGNGIKHGSPENPQLVAQYKYDLNSLYREVEAVGGPGFIRGTHTAWRAGKYVFVGDQVFSATPRATEGGGVVGLGRAFGRSTSSMSRTSSVPKRWRTTSRKTAAATTSGSPAIRCIWVTTRVGYGCSTSPASFEATSSGRAGR